MINIIDVISTLTHTFKYFHVFVVCDGNNYTYLNRPQEPMGVVLQERMKNVFAPTTCTDDVCVYSFYNERIFGRNLMIFCMDFNHNSEPARADKRTG